MSRSGRAKACRTVGIVAVAVTVLSLTSVRPSWGSTGAPLAAEGGSFASPIMNVLQNDPAAVSAISPFAPQYFDANVDQARRDFAAGTTDYAVSEFPLTASEITTATQNGRSFAYVPFAASPVAIATVVECSGLNTFNPATWCGNGNIELTVPILAQIFTDLPPAAQPPPGGGAIGLWNDPLLTALTPDLANASTKITALEDVLPAASNYALESLFVHNSIAKPIWDAYLKFYEGVTDDTPNDIWPHTAGTIAGAGALAQTLIPVNQQSNPPARLPNPATWGLGDVAALPLDWTGAPRNIPAASIQNAAGAFVQPSTTSMVAAVQDSTMDATTNLVTFNANSNDAAAYPIPVMSYLIVPTSGLDAAKATALAAFIKFVLSPTAQADVQSMGAAPVTPAMVTAGLKVADEVAAQGSSTTTTTSTTTASTTTTTSRTTASTTSGPSPGNGAAGASPSTASNSGPSLALTGGVPWLLMLVGGVSVVIGFFTRRAVGPRIVRGGSKR